MSRPTRALRAWERAAAGNPALGFADELLRGFGQVMFQNSPITGLFFLAGLFVGGWHYGAYGLLGTAASTLTARWLGVPTSAVKAGLYGYNGTLVGVGLAYYLGGNALLPGYVALGGVVVAIVAGGLGNLLSIWQIPALTGPFVVTTWVFALGVFGFDRIRAPAGAASPVLPGYATGGRVGLDPAQLWEGLLHGVSQVFLQDSVAVGAIVLLGILASSHVDCLMAAVGSGMGLAVGWLLGADASALTLGLMGYNAALTMIALAGLFYVLDRNSFVLALVAAATSVVVAVALGAAAAPYGGRITTAPFVVTTWIFIAAKPYLHRIKAVPPADATTPEGNLNLYRLTGHWWERSAEA